MKKKIKLKNKVRRVDVQVTILIVLTTIFCTACVFYIMYSLTYRDMLKSLEDRVFAIHDYLEDCLDKDTFQDIGVKEDMQQDSYIKMKKILDNVKKATNVRYLYTAKKNEEGKFVYIIDGLDEEAADFRYPGDIIEKEIYGDMQRALDGETVLPDQIKNTDWGKIFITYFPIHDGEDVVGVLGIEFEAGHQYNTYQQMKVILPIVIFVTCFLATVAAVVCFRRISNPVFKDMSNTDQLTQLKNRNAFETDLHNFDRVWDKKNSGIVVADLNNLKLVNDQLGHGTGDRYIILAGNVIKEVVGKQGIVYRVGGDEYAVLLKNTSEAELEELIRKIDLGIRETQEKFGGGIPLSLSAGYALGSKNDKESMEHMMRRADEDMYRQKKVFHKDAYLDN